MYILLCLHDILHIIKLDSNVERVGDQKFKKIEIGG
jgi:hypothetical protein